jgi:hypothetical protein
MSYSATQQKAGSCQLSACLERMNWRRARKKPKKKKPIGEKMQMPTNKKKLISSNNQ